MKLVSIVAPVFNEQSSLEELHARLSRVMLGEASYRFELVLVDDGSSDDTPAVLARLRDADARVRVIALSRNFGHQLAITAGLDAAVGDAVVIMDADLQHPPEIVPDLLRRWEAGAQVVNTVREPSDDSSVFKDATSRAFYVLFNRLSDVPVQPQGADFRLLDRRAADALRGVRERARFVRGLVHWIGFRQDQVTYRADRRFADRSKFTVAKMMKLAADGLFGFSTAPLAIATWVGLLATLLAAVYGCYALYEKITGSTVAGWTSLLVTVLVLGGVQLLTLGIMGSYVARIYDEVRSRPLYLVSSSDPPGVDQRSTPSDVHPGSGAPASPTP